MSALPLPCPLTPAPDDSRHVCEMYGLGPRDWLQLVNDEWRHVCATVRPEYLRPGKLPRSFHMLPYFRAHALYARSPARRQSANWARADMLEPYFRDDE